MTQRVFALTVALEENVRDDDVQPLIDAIMQMRGVLAVKPKVANAAQYVADQRARADLGEKLLKIVYPPDKK